MLSARMQPEIREQPTEAHARMPAGMGKAYAFVVFNTMSFSITLGAPMILYFKQLGASATVLGIVASLTPLLTIFQIPAADFAERIGYRALMLRGWFLRSLFILGMAGVSLLPVCVGRDTKMALMLALLFLFNLLRGISAVGWLPWITQLLPEKARGQYLSGEQLFGALAGLCTMILSALILGPGCGSGVYGALFLVSFLTAMVSLTFLRHVPDVPLSSTTRGVGPRPWKAMLLHPPFFRLLTYDVVALMSFAGAGVFWIPLLRDYYGKDDRFVLEVAAVASVFVAVTAWAVRRVMDRVGSQPLLALSGLALVAHFGCWAAWGAKALPLNGWTLVPVLATGSVGFTLFHAANMRLAMGTIPAMGRSHFFALFSVVTSLVMGLMPVLWGILVDCLEGWRWRTGAWEWNQYSVLYLALVLLIVAAQFCRRRVPEPKAMTTEAFFHELFVVTPSRALSRLWLRRPFP